MKKTYLTFLFLIFSVLLIGQSIQIDLPREEKTPNATSSTSDSEFLKQPYLLYEGINTQMRFLWQLSETASCEIFWGTDSTYSLGNALSEEYGDDHQHSYTLEGLTPGTKYHYKVVYDTNIFQASFYTAPPEEEENIKFFVYGDTRSDSENHNLNSQAMISNYQEDQAFQSLTLFTGDHVSYGAEESSWQSDFFTINAPNVRKRMAEVPFVPCLGNHEMYEFDYGIDYSTSVFGKYFPFPFVERRYWSFDYGPMHVLILDLYPDYYQLLPPEGFLDPEELGWIEQDLAGTDKPWKVIIMHEPGWSCEGSSSGYSHPNNPDVQELLQPILEDHGVQIVFTAHNHYYARACKNGIYHITTAGGGAPLYEIEEGFPNIISTLKVHHYCKVVIEGDTMMVTAVKPDGEVIDEFYVDQNNKPNHLLGFLSKSFPGLGDISDAVITTSEATTSADETGYYGMELTPGNHVVSVMLEDYYPISENVDVYEGAETQLDTMMINYSCFPDGFTFSSQQDIDAFPAIYPNCTKISGDVTISGANISTLDSLKVLTSIDGELKIFGNDNLSSLYGLRNLSANSITQLSIYNNPLLNECHVQSVCEYLSSDGEVDIYNNGDACTSEEIIESLCSDPIMRAESVANNYQLSLLPNPISQYVDISLNLRQAEPIEIAIYHSLGYCLKRWNYSADHAGDKNYHLNLNDLANGLYICQVRIGYDLNSVKIIKQ